MPPSFVRHVISLAVGLGVLTVTLFFLFLQRVCCIERDEKRLLCFDASHMLLYAVVLTHLPQAVSPLIVILIRDTRDVWWQQLLTSLSFTAAVQLLHYVTTWICSFMTAPNIFPRFLFNSQVFRYLFWYMAFSLQG